MMGSRPVYWLGLISYSIYLTHFPLLLLNQPLAMSLGSLDVPFAAMAGRLLLILLVFSVAAAAYYGIEKPARNWTRNIVAGRPEPGWLTTRVKCDRSTADLTEHFLTPRGYSLVLFHPARKILFSGARGWAKIAAFVEHCDRRRDRESRHKSLSNLAPVDVYVGRTPRNYARTRQPKRLTIQNRRLQHQRTAS